MMRCCPLREGQHGRDEHAASTPAVALGELPVPSANKRAFPMFPLKHLILYVLPS